MQLRRAALALLSLPALLAACAATPSSTGSNPAEATDESACGALKAWGNKCSSEADLGTCSGKIVDGCTDLTSVLNASVLDAAKGCMREAGCDSGPAKCLASAVASAKPTAAHQALTEDYCSKCASALGDACKDPSSNEVIAKLALPLSDDLADEVRQRCTTLPGCAGTFAACAQSVIAKGLAKRLSTETAKCVAESVVTQIDATSTGGSSSGGGGGGSTPPPRCNPRTCEDLHATCGVHDDGCGGSVGCGVCAGSTPCQADDNEKNDSRAMAKSLGTFTDSPLTQTSVKSLTMPDGDEDWFTFHVNDEGWGGNPKITVNAKLPSIDVSAYFLCDNQNDASYCQQGTADNAIGHGCTGQGAVKVEASCNWTITDSGTVVVRVRKHASDSQCTAYDLTVAVAE